MHVHYALGHVTAFTGRDRLPGLQTFHCKGLQWLIDRCSGEVQPNLGTVGFCFAAAVVMLLKQNVRITGQEKTHTRRRAFRRLAWGPATEAAKAGGIVTTVRERHWKSYAHWRLVARSAVRFVEA